MKRFSTPRFVAALAAAAAAAPVMVMAQAPDPLATYYAATIHETRADGSQMWVQLNPDHTFTMRSSEGRTGSGAYTFDPATRTNCITIPNRPTPACAPLPGTKLGDTWDRQGPSGQNEHYVLEPRS